MKDVLNTIDGEQRPPVNGRWLDNIEPATAALLGRIASSDSDDVDLAWQAANAAHPSWSGCTGAERGRWMHRLADAVEANGEELA
ncbi:MAG TPA: 2-hydroxymuconic semialdehyde dehydrogenase, partial [Phycisphaerales bacterium]|nr:2-hydroxymuconic semialdehyde dehydrogenase [Phycisphaerales bacterium]